MMVEPQGDDTSAYASFVCRLAQSSSIYNTLHDFTNIQDHGSQSPVQITVGKIGSDPSLGIQFCKRSGIAELLEELHPNNWKRDDCKLLIIENICGKTITTLGKKFDIDPQFFVDHLNTEPWYRILNIAERTPALPSRRKLHDFVCLQYIEAHTVSNSQCEVSAESADLESGLNGYDVNDARSYMEPDPLTTRIPRKGGKLRPRARKGRAFKKMLCTRQVISIWFKKGDTDTEGWTGVILLDPPFKLPEDNLHATSCGYRDFTKRASLFDDPNESESPASKRELLVRYLSSRFQKDSSLLQLARLDCFSILGDIYKLVASNWVVINEYINRELATIEYILEKEDSGFRDFEIYLKDLYIFRRRITKYNELITHAREQCTARGQQAWPHDERSTIAHREASEIEGDFTYLQHRTRSTIHRIEENIKLLTALVAIGEGKRAVEENSGIVRLNHLATIFLPFSTVGTVMSMNGNYAPGKAAFWVYWSVAIPLTLLVLCVTSFFGVVRGRLHGWARRMRR